MDWNYGKIRAGHADDSVLMAAREHNALGGDVR